MHRHDRWLVLALGTAIALPATALMQSDSTQAQGTHAQSTQAQSTRSGSSTGTQSSAQSDSNTWQQAAKTDKTSSTEDRNREAATTGDDFDTLDSDHDGRISRAEAGASQEFSGRFKTLDGDGDGYVSHDEYREGERATRTPTSTP